MENSLTNSNEQRKTRQRRKKIRNRVLSIVLLTIAAVGIFLLFGALHGQEKPAAGILRYRTTRVSEGEISTTISGSGTLTAQDSSTFTAPAAAHVDMVYKAPGDMVAAGEIVLLLSSDSVSEELSALYDELFTAQTKLAGTTRTRSNIKITAARKGIVKALNAVVGDAVEDLPYLCKISTDGLMQLTVDAPNGLRPYAKVNVVIGEKTVEGTVATIEGGAARITVEDDAYAVGTEAFAYDADGVLIGSAPLDVNEHIIVRDNAGCIAEVCISENDSVSKGTALFKLQEDTLSATYLERQNTVKSLQEQIKQLEDSLCITAEWDGIVASLSVAQDDDVQAGDPLCTLSATTGYTLQLGIDELDIASVSIGQPATLTLDAIEGEFSGAVTNLSYSGSGSYVTTYIATITTESISGVYPGMSASVEIITATSGRALIVPVGAVQYEGNTAFLYLAPSKETQETLDTATLPRITVETGMSDGSYIVVSGEGLSAGDRIYVPTMETAAVYTEEESTVTQFGNMGGMGDGFGGNFGSARIPGGEFTNPGGNMGQRWNRNGN